MGGCSVPSMCLSHSELWVLWPVPLRPRTRKPRPRCMTTDECISSAERKAPAKVYSSIMALLTAKACVAGAPGV